MANFDHRTIGENLLTRFNGHIASDRWVQLVNEPSLQNLENLREEGFRQKMLPPIMCKRVFISHRQVDVVCAERIAYLATASNFHYWLDVHDPQLMVANQAQIPSLQKSVLVAGIIEMALINCTHVLAVMTHNTRGSEWVPYEYGRIADAPGIDSACTWQHPLLATPPEYMYLRDIHHSEQQICAWFNTQNANPNCQLPWTGNQTHDLP